jgi:hypothetical protein
MAERADFWKPEAPWPTPEKGGKRVAITGGRLIDGNGGPVVKDPVIVLRGNRIEAVGALAG